MKKFIFSALAAIGLLLSPSCSDENEALSGSGNEALVSFSVNLADGIQTKAIGDGTTAKKLQVDVYEISEGNYAKLGNLTAHADFDADKKATVNMTLVKGKEYGFVFWAQSENARIYTVDNQTISINYATDASCNNEDNDAFLATDRFVAKQSFNREVILRRPLAQLNYLVSESDLRAAERQEMSLTNLITSIEISNAATELYPFTNTVSGNGSAVTFAATRLQDLSSNNTSKQYLELPKIDGSIDSQGNPVKEKFYYLATTYFLVKAGDNTKDSGKNTQALVDTKMTIGGLQAGDYALSVQNVPVQWNHRTNIYGNLLTASGQFVVKINPLFEEEDINLPNVETVSSVEEIQTALANGSNTIKAAANFTIPADGIIPVPKNEDNVNEKEISFDFSAVDNTSSTLTFKETIGTGQATAKNVSIIANGNVVIDLPNASVTLNGAYNEVTATTWDNTLIVPSGTTIEHLKVNQGNVKIFGTGIVKEITKADGYQGTITYNISTAEQLSGLSTAINAGSGDLYTMLGKVDAIHLENDIDLNNEEWQPIGTKGKPFTFTFDGQNHTISNLSINKSNEAYVGLFGVLNEAGKIQNVKIENASVKGQSRVGALVGSAYIGTVSDCVISGNVKIEGNYQVGGLTGYGYATISDCSVTGNSDSYVKGVYLRNDLEGDAVGGIIGYYAEGQKTLANCSASINVEGTRKVGGLAGQVGYGGITVSGTFTGTVSTNADKNYISTNASKIMVGGIVGEMTGSEGKINTITINATITSGSIVKGVDPTTTGLIIGGSRPSDAILDINSSNSDDAILMILIAPGLTLVNGDYEISSADGLKAFAKAVNEDGNSFSNQYVYLSNEIDLNNEAWTPVGQTGAIQFMGTFDGRDHTISNLKINNTDASKNCSTGLFGWLNSAIVKNVKMHTADVTGHHNVGVIAGYLETSGCTIENCHVANATISCTSVNGDANGDKCGGIVGHAGNAGVWVKDCTVESSTISAGRDAGQVVGAALTANVENCSADNVTVIANGTSTGANIRNEVIGRVL